MIGLLKIYIISTKRKTDMRLSSRIMFLITKMNVKKMCTNLILMFINYLKLIIIKIFKSFFQLINNHLLRIIFQMVMIGKRYSRDHLLKTNYIDHNNILIIILLL